MTLPELQKQALQLPINDRWKLVQTLLESLQWETRSVVKRVTCLGCEGLPKVPTG
jgi:hypothetical protein